MSKHSCILSLSYDGHLAINILDYILIAIICIDYYYSNYVEAKSQMQVTDANKSRDILSKEMWRLQRL